MKRNSFLIAAFSLAILVSITYGGITGKLAGKVTDKENREPLIGASVVIQGTTFGAAADVQGEFYILNIPSGTYTVRISAIGYQTATYRNVQISADATTRLDVELASSAVEVKEVIVQAERPLVEKSVTSTIRRQTAQEIRSLPRENIQGLVALTVGVVNGVNFRGSRTTDNVLQVDGLQVNDPQTGFTGGIFPTVSNLAVEEVQVITGGFTAEYGNAQGGVINTITKEGSTEIYEGTFRYKRDVEDLNGVSDKGYKLNGLDQNFFEFSFGGGIPVGARTRFNMAGKFDYQKYRSNSYAFKDLLGKNIGKRPHDRFAERTLNLKITSNPTDNIKLSISGFNGGALWENSSWTWLYGDYTQQPSFTLFNSQYFARVTHTLSNATFYELTGAYFSQEFRSGKKNEATDYNFLFDAFDIFGIDDRNGDGIIDRYTPTGTSGYGINPTTGHREGPAFTQGNQNPYGVVGSSANVISFVMFGNDRTLQNRDAKYMSLGGSVSSQVDNNNLIKTGAEIKLHEVFREYNSLPWDANPFDDSYRYKPIQIYAYVQDKIEYQGIIVNAGVRFDYLDPNAKRIANLLNPGNPPATIDATVKNQVSPRFGVSFPLTERSKFSLNYGWYMQEPVLTRLYESITTYDLSRGNQIFGNPDLDPQKTKAFEIGYANQFTDMLAIDVTAYYKDLYNIDGVTFVPAVPSSFTLYSTSEYGNSRGIELSLRKQLANYWRAQISYAYSIAKGTASSVTTNYQLVTNGPPDPYTGQSRVYPLTDYYLDFDRRHVVNFIFDFVFRDGEGPTIGGVHFLQNLNVNFTTVFQTGTPYTRIDYYGRQVGEFNGSRRPSFMQTDMRLSRDIPLSSIFGASFKNLTLTFFADVTNLFNRVKPVDLYAITGVADNDGFVVSTPSATPWVKGDSKSVDAAGFPLYNQNIDLDKNGLVDQSEKLYGINKLRQDYFDSRINGNYQLARRVWVGAIIRF
ncbi:MAG: TonB-dependent receptor [Ignavibacteriales bacterium]|nr:TonB-dependent receptor [Ignavibacteriales bacterium]